jgi:Fanconi anemia group M protein
MIKDFTPRLYQQTILATAAEKNTLVVLPTGLGKTHIFLMLASLRLSKYPESKILFLGPTRPLITQYYELFVKHLEIEKEKMAIFTGDISPEKREKMWLSSQIIFSTPQGLENDVISGKISLTDVSLLGFDEAHRAVGDYSYVWIAKQYMKNSKFPRIIGLTASPGSDLESITDVCKNLHIEDVEIRTENDPDVKPYIQEVNIKWIYVELPTHFKEIQKYLTNCLKSKVVLLKEVAPDIKTPNNKSDFLRLQGELLKEISNGSKDYEKMKALSVVAEAMKVQHAIEMLESQGISPLLEYMEDLVEKAKTTKTRAVQNLVADLNFKTALIIARNLKELKIEHPKYAELKKILSANLADPKKKIIVFSQYRDSISSLIAEIKKLPNVRPEMFVGQQKKKGTGLSQKEQIKILDDFRNNDYNVLVMSSVGEEGLDIPSVDMVIFYEPVPSAIRTIQRRGRTGRQSEGEVIVLVTKGTRDEAYRWVSFHKEKRMYSILDDLKKKFTLGSKQENKTISDFILPDNGVTVYADYREKSSGIIKKLIELGIKINLQKLEIGDYLLSERVVVEYKTVPDFVDSILDKRLLSQLKDMKRYQKQIIILEGDGDIYSQRQLHPNAVRGMIATICVDYGIPIIRTKDADDSALTMAMIAKREQTDDNREFTMHGAKPLTLKEQQEYIVSALPGVGPILSKPLLLKFQSVKNIVNATEKELKEVDLIGDKKAAKIKEIVDSEYRE